jgi:hypothetical protein
MLHFGPESTNVEKVFLDGAAVDAFTIFMVLPSHGAGGFAVGVEEL